MSATEKDKSLKATGIPGVKPARQDQLPPEEQFQVSTDTPGLYGDFTKDREDAAKAVVEKKEDNALEWLKTISARAGQDMAYYAGQTSYEFEFDDGRTERYDRIAPIDYQWDELEDLRAEVESSMSMDDRHKLDRIEHRHKTKLLEQLKAEYYLVHAKTRKPMTPDIKAHVKNSDRLGCILDAVVLSSLHKAVVGKK